MGSKWLPHAAANGMSCSMSWPNRALGYIEVKPSLLVPLAALALCYGFRLGCLRGLLATAMIACSLLLHELGHVLIASVYGVKVRKIGLATRGGYTVRESSGRRWVEAQSAAAGPLVNLLIFVILRSAGGAVAPAVANANLVLAIGNLIPIGRTDGWRLWQAISSLETVAARESIRSNPAISAEPQVVEAAGVVQKASPQASPVTRC
jgi:Zn-dependent protease